MLFLDVNTVTYTGLKARLSGISSGIGCSEKQMMKQLLVEVCYIHGLNFTLCILTVSGEFPGTSSKYQSQTQMHIAWQVHTVEL